MSRFPEHLHHLLSTWPVVNDTIASCLNYCGFSFLSFPQSQIVNAKGSDSALVTSKILYNDISSMNRDSISGGQTEQNMTEA